LAAAKPAGPVATNPATGSISVLKNKSVEDILYKWSTELDNYTREFQRQAIQIQKWDQAIVSNGALVS
jgi:nuclear pore complex protein Nup62